MLWPLEDGAQADELRDSVSVGVEGGSNSTFCGEGVVKQLLEVDGVGEVITRTARSMGSGEVATEGARCCCFWAKYQRDFFFFFVKA